MLSRDSEACDIWFETDADVLPASEVLLPPVVCQRDFANNAAELSTAVILRQLVGHSHLRLTGC